MHRVCSTVATHCIIAFFTPRISVGGCSPRLTYPFQTEQILAHCEWCNTPCVSMTFLGVYLSLGCPFGHWFRTGSLRLASVSWLIRMKGGLAPGRLSHRNTPPDGAARRTATRDSPLASACRMILSESSRWHLGAMPQCGTQRTQSWRGADAGQSERNKDLRRFACRQQTFPSLTVSG